MPELGAVVALARLFGQAPYTITSSGGVLCLQRSAFKEWLSLVALLTCGAASLAICFLHVSGDKQASSVHWSAEAIGHGLCAAYLVTSLLFSRFTKYPRLVELLNSSPVQQASRSAAVLLPAVFLFAVHPGCCAAVLLLGLHPDVHEDAMAKGVLSLLPFVVMESAEVSLAGYLVSCASHCFRGVAADLAVVAGKTAGTEEDREGRVRDVRYLRRKHKAVSDMMETLSASFGAAIFLGYLIALWWVALFLETMLIYPIALGQRVCVGLWLGGMLAAKLCFVTVVSRALKRANRVISIIHWSRNLSDLTDRKDKELHLFSQQVSQNPVIFSLGGVADLSFGLVMQGAAAAVSYLVILLQFQSTPSETSTPCQ